MALANITRLHSDTPILCGLACVIPTLAALAPLQISSAAVIAAFFVCLRRIQNGGPWFFRQATYIILILSLIIWSGLSSIWSIDGLHSLSAAFRLLLAATTLIILVDAALRLGFSDKDVFLKWMAYGAIIGVAVTLIYIATIYFHTIWIQKTKMEDYELNALNRSASVIAIFLWPWTFAILKTLGRYSATLFVTASSVTLVLLAPSAPLLAVVSAAALFSIAWHFPLLGKVTLTSMYLFSILIVPYLGILVPRAVPILSDYLPSPTAMVHRLMIWQFTAESILQKPLLGWGLNTARILPGGEQEITIGTAQEGTAILGQALPLHPHNAVIQIWLELGLVGLILFSALFFVLVMTIPTRRTERPAGAIYASVLTAGLVVSQLGFGFWQGWWLATLGIAAVLTIASAGPSKINTPSTEHR